MDQITSIVRLIGDYGMMVIVCGIFLYLILKFANLGINYAQSRLNKKKETEFHESRMSLREGVNTQITELLNSYFQIIGGNRIQVMEFSNSVTSVAYLPFKYMTCTYETTKIGVPSTAKNISKLPTSLYTTFLRNLYDNLHCIVDLDDPNAITYSGAFYSLMQENGDRCILCAIIKDAKGKALGYVSLQDSANNFTEHDIEKMDELAMKLSSLLGIAEAK